MRSVKLLNLTYNPGTGGIDSYFWGLAQGNPHVQFTVFSATARVSEHHELPNVAVTTVAGALGVAPRIVAALSRFDPLLWLAVRVASKSAEQADLVVCRHPAFHFARVKGPRVYLFATALPEYFESIIRNAQLPAVRRGYIRVRQVLYRALERRIVRQWRCAVLSLAKRAELAQSCGVTPEILEVVPPGVNVEHFTASPRTWPSPSDPVDVACIGRLSPEKNHRVLVELARIARGRVRVHVVGDGPCRHDLEQQAEALNAPIKFYGFREDVRPVLNRCHVFVLPSVYEGFGHVLLEAMASGLPCVALDPALGFNVASTEIIAPGVDGFLADNDPRSLLSSIEMIVGSPETFQQMQSGAVKKAAMFSWRMHLQRLATIVLAPGR